MHLTHLTFGLLVATLASVDAVAQLPPATTGDLLVASAQNNRLLRLAFDGTQLGEFTYTNLSHTRGVVVDPAGTIYVVSQNTNEVLVLDRDLKLIRRFSTKNVNSPTGAALSPRGELYVAGFNSSNVGVFKADGTFLRAVTATALRFSNCVAFRGDGHYFVASAGNGSVVQFDGNDKFVRSFSGYGLSSPMGLAIWNNELYAAGGGSSNIVVFDRGGKALRQVRHQDISGPQGIAFTTGGDFVVSSFYSNKLSWYTAGGKHLRTVLPKSSSVPRSIAMLPSAELRAPGKPVLGRPLAIDLSSPFDPRLGYIAALSLTQKPGIRLPDGRVLGLNLDAAFLLSLDFPGFIGVLDTHGAARINLWLPDLPWLRGLRVHMAALTVDPQQSNPFRQITATSTYAY